MIYEYIVKNFKDGEPIFLNEIPGSSKDVIRQEMKKLTDNKKLVRVYNGVYYKAYKTMFGTDGKMSIHRYMDKKYLNIDGKPSGFITGYMLVNKYGFTTQNPAVYEICSNAATTKQRKLNIYKFNMIIYKPVDKITKKNINELEFLELMSVIDKYSELKGEEYRKKLKKYVDDKKINFDIVKKYLPLYPRVVYKNIYEGGLMNELV